jgi:hypothetical protein
MVARLGAAAHAKDPAFLSDADAAALQGDSGNRYQRVMKRLQSASLKNDQRVNFYALGAGEALLMDLGVFFSNP